MQAEFFASQVVVIDVIDQPVPIQHYLRQPQRLVYALTDPSRVELLDSDCFRLKMRSLSFLMLNLQPTVDMQVTVAPEGKVSLRSLGCEIRGIEYIDQRFQFDLVGYLNPLREGGKTSLVGQADLRVQVDLPPLLWFTPKPLLEAAGNGLLKSVLQTIKQRLMHQLLLDYAVWAGEMCPQSAEINLAPAVPAHPPIAS
jgi:Protein of unknown function (DUF1997)